MSKSRLFRMMSLSVACLASGCTPPSAPTSKSELLSGPVQVELVQPKKQCLRRAVEQPGAIEPFEETRLFGRVSGYVSKVHTDIGQKVRGPRRNAKGEEIEPGDLLIEIAVPDLEKEAEQKQALIRQAEAEVEQARKALASAEASIATAEAGGIEAKAQLERWESESKRIMALVKGGVIDAQTQDETQNQYKAAGARMQLAQAALRKATAERDKSNADVVAAQARVDVARANAGQVQATLSYAKIRAPFDGVVTSRKVHPGDLIQPTGGKDELVTVTRLDPVRVVIHIPETEAGMVRGDAEVKLSIPALGLKWSGPLSRTSWSLTGGRTLRAEMDLPNKDGVLRPGMYVYASIAYDCPENWTLPAAAIAKQGDAMVCYRIENGKAVRTPVQIGRSDGIVTEVLKFQNAGAEWSDWTGSESIAARALGLSDGQAVTTTAKSK